MTHAAKQTTLVLKTGSRESQLALVQTRDALRRIAEHLPGVRFDLVPCSSPGDRDRQTDLRVSPGDFFTRDLDLAVLDGRLDLAVHSAKDLPDPVTEGLDWFWLPWREDPRDALILPKGKNSPDLVSHCIIGVSSERREAWCRKRFPNAVLTPIRGNIEQRLAQLDDGKFDALLMAGAALSRLGLTDRITEWISLEELPAPAGQGSLAVTFRKGDPAMTAVRNLFIKAVRFVGGGVGSAGLCTIAGAEELAAADVCLYDVLMDEQLLRYLPPHAERIFVGKRAGNHAVPQKEISRLLAEYAHRGLRVVRLKGGDPGLFGRLAEELDELDRWQIPYRILPGVSSLTAATTGTGMLLTRRGLSRGFTAMTPRAEGGAVASVTGETRAKLPLVLFMASQVADQIANQLLADGWMPETPAAFVLNAGADDELIHRTTLAALADAKLANPSEAPGLLIIGEIARFGARLDSGALAGRRVLLTGSDALLKRSARRVIDFGGRPVCRPLIRLVPLPEARQALHTVTTYDAVVITSPSAARCFLELAVAERLDLRRLPRLFVCGPGTAEEFVKAGIHPDMIPAGDFGAEGLLCELRKAASVTVRESPCQSVKVRAKAAGTHGRTRTNTDEHGQAPFTILRLRSDKAGDGLAGELRKLGATVDDCVLYANEPIHYETLPEFDAVFFASASAVEVFAAQWGTAALDGKIVAVIGQPTAAALRKLNREPDVTGFAATVDGALDALAAYCVRGRLVECMTRCPEPDVDCGGTTPLSPPRHDAVSGARCGLRWHDTAFPHCDMSQCSGASCRAKESGVVPPQSKSEGASCDVAQNGGRPPYTTPALNNLPAQWPHAPPHWLYEPGIFMITAGIYGNERLLHSPARLNLVQELLFKCAAEFGWQLEAWAIMANHYHFVARSSKDPENLPKMLGKFHMLSSKELNRLDGTPGRKIWHNYHDSAITFERSYLARLNYVQNNPVHHGVTTNAQLYPWCSAGWFETVAAPAFRNTVASFKTDTINIFDEF